VSATEPENSPDQRAFETDATKPSFLAGVYRGDWRIDSVAWPIVTITIAAAPRETGPASFTLRCDFTNYPAHAPTATPWDPDADTKLPASRRPKGEEVGVVFRHDWEDGRALYTAYDRVALTGHQNWVIEHPRTAWNGQQDLTWWVLRIWELLNCDDYEGI